ncbi:MAG: hypothetical protein WCE80_03385 [Acidimicrobiia bacterium]
MKRSILGLVAAVALVGSIAGIALASPDDSTSSTVVTTPTVPDEQGSSTTFDDSTSTSIDSDDDTTSTSIDDNDETTSTTIDDEASEKTAASVSDDDDSTSTTIDDRGHYDDDVDGTTSTTIDDDHSQVVQDQTVSHDIPGVGTVTVEVRDGKLGLVDFSAPGWDARVETQVDKIKVKFRDGTNEVEYEAELNDGQVKVAVETHSS